MNDKSNPLLNLSLARSGGSLRAVLLRVALLALALNLFWVTSAHAAKPTPPAAPSNLSASAVSSSQINLAWQDNSSNETGFSIERAPSASGPWSQIATVGAGVRSYANTGLNGGTPYYYRVRAYNSKGNSAYSNTSGATTSQGPSCSYSISPTSASYPSTGGGGTVTVSATAGCGWTASANAGWIAITSGSSGSGNGAVGYSIAANTSTSSRSGTMTIAGDTFTVSQEGAPASPPPPGGDVALVNGQPYSDSLTASTSQSGWKYYYIDVPAGSSSLVLDLYNMSSDVDLYVKYGVKPTLSVWECRPYIGGTVEQCTFNSPAAGRWWIGVNNYSVGTISYLVKATATGGSTPDTTPPSVPANLSASAASSSQINLSWSGSVDSGGSGLAGYRVYRYGVLIGTTTGTSYTDTGLPASSTYCYTVAAYDGAGNVSGQSGQSCATTSAAADTTPPSVPTGLSASTASSSQINLSWGGSVDSGGAGLAGYRIYRYGVLIATTGGTSYTDSGLPASSTYCYTVAAYDGAGNVSGQSGQSCATTSAAADTTPPSVPTGLSASAASSSQINLSWGGSVDSGGSGLAGYRIYRFGVLIATTGGTSYTDSGLPASSTYCYTVAAYDGAGNVSAQSGQSCATTSAAADTTPPSVPTGLSASAVSSSQINLSWGGSVDSGGSGLAGYRIFRFGVLIATTGGTSYTDSGLPASSTYCYTVAAYDGAGNVSGQSGQACATTQAPPPPPPVGDWVASPGSFSPDTGYATTTDGSGDVLVAGAWNVGPSAFLAKYSADGVQRWWQTFVVTGTPRGIAVDSSGHIYITGSYFGSGNFGGDWLSGDLGSASMFVAKFAPDGTHVWSRGFPGANVGRGIAIDRDGNVLVTGSYFSMDLGGGPLPLGSSSGSIFVARLSGANGSYLWGTQFGGNLGSGTGIATDSSGNIYFSGFTMGAMNFGGGTRGSTVGNDYNAVVVKLAASGAHIWSSGFRVGAWNVFGILYGANAIAVAANGDVALTGSYVGTASFGGASLTANGSSMFDIFFARFSSNGSHLWSKGVTSSSASSGIGNAAAFDANGNVFFTGRSLGAADFGGMATSSSGTFVTKYGANGVCHWVRGYGGNTQGYGIAIDSSKVAVTGNWSGGVDFGGGLLNSLGGSQDVFLLKVSP